MTIFDIESEDNLERYERKLIFIAKIIWYHSDGC